MLYIVLCGDNHMGFSPIGVYDSQSLADKAIKDCKCNNCDHKITKCELNTRVDESVGMNTIVIYYE